MPQLFSCHVNEIMAAPISPNAKSLPDFRTIYKLYADKVYRKCIGMLKEEALAMDATQDVFVKVFQNLSKFRWESKVSSWIYSIAHNCCIDRLRRRKRQPIAEELYDNLAVSIEIPYYEVLDEQINQLETVLTLLSDDYREILLMKYQEGLSIKAIAFRLNKSESAVKMKMKRAREKARRYRRELLRLLNKLCQAKKSEKVLSLS